MVDDEPAILRALTVALRARGYTVDTATDGAGAIDLIATVDPAAVVLDLGLPDLDGIEVCRRVREWSEVPIIVLTADGADDRKVAALDTGADDYVTKPFSTPELLARLRVALRHRTAGDWPVPSDDAVQVVGDVEVDQAHHTVTVGGRPLSLTPKEFGFLAVLARHPGRVLTHRAILQAVWGDEYGTETQYLRVYASQLRKKLGDTPDHRRLVTEPGVGYRLVDPGAEMSVVVQLLGYPGTGKYTVAKELVRAMEADGRTTRLLDNHASGNLILSLVPTPTRGIPAPVMDRIIEVRDAVLDHARAAHPARLVDRLHQLPAERRTGPGAGSAPGGRRRHGERAFVPVLLECDPDELLRRVVAPERAARHKLVDPVRMQEILDEPVPLPPWDDIRRLDVTTLAPPEAARAILELLPTR